MDTTTRPSLWKYFILCLTKKYCAFSGTAPRREFWGFFLFMNLFSFIFSLVGGVIVAVTLPWGELAAMQDPEQMQAILFTRIASFFFITQIVLLVLYLPTLGVIIFLNWAILERFQYPGGTATQFLGIISTAYWLLLLILACFPTRPAVESTPE